MFWRKKKFEDYVEALKSEHGNHIETLKSEIDYLREQVKKLQEEPKKKAHAHGQSEGPKYINPFGILAGMEPRDEKEKEQKKQAYEDLGLMMGDRGRNMPLS